MTEEQKKVEQGFYEECARLLGVTYTCEAFPYNRRTRWNNRAPGAGRYPGCGLIRAFGPNAIHVSLNKPITVNRQFNSMDAVLIFLKENI